jgi:hypothetical protein
VIPFATRVDSLLKEIAESASELNDEDKAEGASHASGTLEKKSFPCPICMHGLETAPPLICPTHAIGRPAEAEAVSSHWTEHRNTAPDSPEGNDGRHIADGQDAQQGASAGRSAGKLRLRPPHP